MLQTVSKLPQKLNNQIQVFHRPVEFYELIKQSDLVITAGGLFAFECLMHGMPGIGLPQYPHQLETLQKLSDLESLVLGSVGMSLQHDYFCETLEMVLNSYERRQVLSNNGLALIDSQGLSRIMRKIQTL